MDITLNTSVTFQNKFTKQQLQDFLDAIPYDAEIRVSVYNGDQRDPGTTTTFSATWKSSPRQNFRTGPVGETSC